MKTVRRYEIRVFKAGDVYSKSTNNRLYERPRALKIMRFLKKRGIEAHVCSYSITA